MNRLNSEGFDLTGVFIWFGMDKYGRIAIMLNNGIGTIPSILQNPNAIEHKMAAPVVESPPKVDDDYLYQSDRLLDLRKNREKVKAPLEKKEADASFIVLDDDEKKAIEALFFEEVTISKPHLIEDSLDEDFFAAELNHHDASSVKSTRLNLNHTIPLKILLAEEHNLLHKILDKVHKRDPLSLAIQVHQHNFKFIPLDYDREKYSLLRLEHNTPSLDEHHRVLGLLEAYHQHYVAHLLYADLLSDPFMYEKKFNELTALKRFFDDLSDEYGFESENLSYDSTIVDLTNVDEFTQADELKDVDEFSAADVRDELINFDTAKVIDEGLDKEELGIHVSKVDKKIDNESSKSILDEFIDETVDSDDLTFLNEKEWEQLADLVIDNNEFKNGSPLFNDMAIEVNDFNDISLKQRPITQNTHSHSYELTEGKDRLNEDPSYKTGYIHASFASESDETSLTRIQGVKREKGSDSLAKGFANLALQRGFYIYQAMYGDRTKVDHHNPVEHINLFVEDKTQLGDYYRYLQPDNTCTIESIPEDLKHLVVVSDILDFSKDRLLSEESINDYFSRLYRSIY